MVFQVKITRFYPSLDHIIFQQFLQPYPMVVGGVYQYVLDFLIRPFQILKGEMDKDVIFVFKIVVEGRLCESEPAGKLFYSKALEPFGGTDLQSSMKYPLFCFVVLFFGKGPHDYSLILI
jgi:hypothetical protein